MIPEFGHFALILALMLATLLALVPLAGSITRRPDLQAFARPLASGQFVFVAIAFGCLAWAFVTDDFSVAYVANNSNSLLPWYYKFSAVWGSHEGSLLLWILILTAWTVAVAIFSRRLPTELVSLVLSIMGMISVAFLLFILITSNPFTRLLPNVPADGADLNPLLQDFGLVIHPPMLYMGYVGFSVAFAFSIAALINGRMDGAWARWSRPWTTVAWCFLSLGIALGSWWAYYELGWGGWWFWDPVENASVLPWLAGTALMHSLAVTEKRGVFKSWTVLLAIVTFSLSLLGTFLVRSGVLTSVHAFAADPARGKFLIGVLAVTIIGSLTLYAFRAPVVHARVRYGSLSREIFLLLNNVLLMAAMLLVLVGTLYPLVLDYLGAGSLSVGKPFFDLTFSPVAIAVALLLGAGVFSRWKRTDGGWLGRQLLWPAAISLVLAVIVPLWLGHLEPWAFAGCFAAAWVSVATFRDLWARSASRQGRWTGLRRLTRSYYGMVLGHLGVAVVMAGATVVTNYGVERDVRMVPGETVEMSGLTFHFDSLRHRQGPNYSAEQGRFVITREGEPVTTLYPEKRVYAVQRNVMTEAGIDGGLFRDLFVALGEPVGDDAWAVRIQYKPLVRWVWLGAIFMALGGALAIADRRYRMRVTRESPETAKQEPSSPEAVTGGVS
ncbi:heme lyase CcmF/NrfE family subunit [Marinobacter halodurans]|uniref:Heme lyase CcmF/NrfE family subunit n=1 Tax=Marinobacter halodurans TaxID=2528979 RepID=A0ABY1ZTJ7_9GAMM|nr:heme lyase CcmF/NrfE family subunit [Marinobacter halodurans]TBW59409.1 heme lyase CcmF/NrfE family subunit [Marinobacter halodurans]